MRSELERLCDREGVKIESTYGANLKTPEWAEKNGTHPYRVTLTFRRHRLTCDFFMGLAHTREPTAGDVLSALILDAGAVGQDFESWCADLGYEADSRKAEATYKQCLALGKRVHRLLGDRFEEFARARAKS